MPELNHEKIVKAYFNQHPDVSAVYIYGSYAMGRQHQKSDLDLGILFSNHDHCAQVEFMRRVIRELSRKLPMELHIVSLGEANTILLKQLFTKGHPIVVNNPKHLALFKMRAYAQIADFGYAKQIMESGFLRKVTSATTEGHP